jgi:hypothetical protein
MPAYCCVACGAGGLRGVRWILQVAFRLSASVIRTTRANQYRLRGAEWSITYGEQMNVLGPRAYSKTPIMHLDIRRL